jgi:hypothetical protein
MKLLIVLSSVAVLTAACASSATVSGSSNGSFTTAKSLHLNGAANAGDISDLSRPNPPVHKAPGMPITTQAAPANHATQPAAVQPHDRCTIAASRPGKSLPTLCPPA